MQKKKILKIVCVLALVTVACVLVVLIMPYAIRLKNPEDREAFGEFIRSFGVIGVCIMFGVQVLQVILAIIPGEPIEILAGLLYGTWGGLALCLVGIFVASAAIFFTVRLLGRGFIEKMINSEKYSKLKFLTEPTKRDTFMFILYVIPGTPKDMLTYFAPCTGINPLRFLVICTVSRIPSVISSTYVGASITDGNLLLSVLVFVGTAILGIVGIYINNKLMEKKRISSENTEEKAG